MDLEFCVRIFSDCRCIIIYFLCVKFLQFVSTTKVFNSEIFPIYGCIETKNTTQMLLRDISRCCKEVALPSKVLWRHGMCWSY